jgi:hypothetical protein
MSAPRALADDLASKLDTKSDDYEADIVTNVFERLTIGWSLIEDRQVELAKALAAALK